MSGFAKFTIAKSYRPERMAVANAAATGAALISGAWSYVVTFGDGTSSRSSPKNGSSRPPLKK